MLDETVPTVSSVAFGGTAVTLTVSEPVAAATAPTTGDFVVKDDNVAATVSSVTAPTGSNTGTTVRLSMGAAIGSGSTVSVVYTANAGRLLKDLAGNALAGFTLTNDSEHTLEITAVSGGYVNNAEDESSA